MDIVNTKIGQGAAREAASVVSDRSFVSSNLVGAQTGASAFTKSENNAVINQTRHADKTLINLPDQQSEPTKKTKANKANADTTTREENVSFSQSLSSLSELLQTNGTKLSFTISEDAKQPVVIVSDKESGNIIRQIPSEEMQKFAERVKEFESTSSTVPGMVLERQA
ncbi:MAG: flagellar protein FlaG [Glaciecola sp.]